MSHLHILRGATVLMTIASLFGLAVSKPRHISGPDDRHVFSGDTATLTCEVEDVTEFHAVAWQYFDGSGSGYIIGRCFGCSSITEPCDVHRRDDSYTMSRDGNIYELGIPKLRVPDESSHGYYQCGYFTAEGCGYGSPRATGMFYPFQSAIVFVYDFPTCNLVVAQMGDVEFNLDFTCTLEPRFYRPRAVQARLLVNGTEIEPDIELPFGAMLRAKSDNYSCLEETLTRSKCEVLLPGKEAHVLDCDFPYRWNETVAALIEPVTATIQRCQLGYTKDVKEEGEVIEMRCHAYPNSSIVRRWVIFQEGGKREEVSSPTRTMAGDVQFLSDTRERLLITPRSSGTYFIECIVDPDNNSSGGVASAFASFTVTM